MIISLSEHSINFWPLQSLSRTSTRYQVFEIALRNLLRIFMRNSVLTCVSMFCHKAVMKKIPKGGIDHVVTKLQYMVYTCAETCIWICSCQIYIWSHTIWRTSRFDIFFCITSYMGPIHTRFSEKIEQIWFESLQW